MLTKKEIEMKHNTNFRIFPSQEESLKVKGISRQEYNGEILQMLGELIMSLPDQRFGQIICNYVLPKYREMDPFFEESKETYERLTVLLEHAKH